MADSRSSFFGSISPWGGSRASTPPPVSRTPEPSRDKTLAPSDGHDHAISLRPSPSLRRYPKDCPPLKTRWYYAVDLPKRKPFQELPEEPSKPLPVPKKLVPFSANDSKAIESAFQSLDPGHAAGNGSHTTGMTSTKVPVNEDYLFDVHIEKRELEPAYWLGPVYEVRRASWFFAEGSFLRPCDENMANQIEEGYLKTAPWRKSSLSPPRATSQPPRRPASAILEGIGMSPKASSPTLSPVDGKSVQAASAEPPGSYRLFGAYMNTTVTYQDASIAYLSSDDFMSRMSSTVYGRFGGVGGTKVVRGYSEPGKPAETTTAKETDMGKKGASTNVPLEKEAETARPPVPPKRTPLERQISSLAGLAIGHDTAPIDDEEEARQEEQQEMEAARDTGGEDQGRKIDHLILVTHGIGQRLGLRLDSINFVHDVNTMRKTMKGVYASSPDLQALTESPTNCGIQVLPICWRHMLDFPKQTVRQNRKELDIGDVDGINAEDEYPSLQDITVEGVPYVRALTSDLVLDVLLYQSGYREHIAKIVQKETNRVLELFKKRTGFTGTVSLCGHSLGSAILFDILCRQTDPNESQVRRRVSSKSSYDARVKDQDLQLGFDCDNFFCLGSPIALFQMLKGRTLVARTGSSVQPTPMSPFDPESTVNDPFSQRVEKDPRTGSGLLPITTSSPKCSQLFNVFHPTDPIAYRMEPLISSAMATLKPQQLPYTKKGLFAAPGIANISARVSQQVMSSWYNLTSGVASTLINRSLGLTGDEQVLSQDKIRPNPNATAPGDPSKQGASAVSVPVASDKRQQALAEAVRSGNPTNNSTLVDGEMETLYTGFQKRRASATSDSSDEPLSAVDREIEEEKARRLKREEAKVRALNSNGRVDYSIQEGMFDVSLLASIASHLGYWADEDVNHFLISQTLKGKRAVQTTEEME